MRSLTLGAVILLFPCASAMGAKIIVGSHPLLPDTPNQKILICVLPEPGDPLVSGADMIVQIADGGPADPDAPIDGPTISYVQLADDFTTPGYDQFHTAAFGRTIFDGGCHIGRHSLRPQIYVDNTPTSMATGTATAAVGLLAILTIDTTGTFESDGPWDLRLGDTIGPSTTLLELYQPPDPTPDDPNDPLPALQVRAIDLTIVDGQIRVPEPSSLALLLLGGLGFLLWRRCITLSSPQVPGN